MAKIDLEEKQMKMKYIALFLITSTALAQSKNDIQRFRQAMKSKVGIGNQIGDVRLNILKVAEPICGSSGNSLIAEFQVKRFEKSMNQDGSIELNPYHETVKTYGIPAKNIPQLSDKQLKNEIMDSETCLE
jgi:hypothetical protein